MEAGVIDQDVIEQSELSTESVEMHDELTEPDHIPLISSAASDCAASHQVQVDINDEPSNEGSPPRAVLLSTLPLTAISQLTEVNPISHHTTALQRPPMWNLAESEEGECPVMAVTFEKLIESTGTCTEPSDGKQSVIGIAETAAEAIVEAEQSSSLEVCADESSDFSAEAHTKSLLLMATGGPDSITSSLMPDAKPLNHVESVAITDVAKPSQCTAPLSDVAPLPSKEVSIC